MTLCSSLSVSCDFVDSFQFSKFSKFLFREAERGKEKEKSVLQNESDDDDDDDECVHSFAQLSIMLMTVAYYTHLCLGSSPPLLMC